MFSIKVLGQLVRVVTLTYENILASSFANLDCESEDLFLLSSGGRCPCGRTFLVLSLLVLEDLLLLLLRQTFKVEVLQIVQIARQA